MSSPVNIVSASKKQTVRGKHFTVSAFNACSCEPSLKRVVEFIDHFTTVSIMDVLDYKDDVRTSRMNSCYQTPAQAFKLHLLQKGGGGGGGGGGGIEDEPDVYRHGLGKSFHPGIR